MATHEPYFKVLREDVFAEERNRNNNCRKCGQPGHWADQCTSALQKPAEEQPSTTSNLNGGEYKLIEKPFIFLDIPTLREYLEAEMRPSGEIPFKFDADRAIDDWIFLCFFVGNDFLPHLPSLEIREGAIDILIDIYKQNAARLGGYICKDGVVNLARVAVIMTELGKVEETIFRKRREKEERRMENAKRRKQQSEMDREANEEYRRLQMALHHAQQEKRNEQPAVEVAEPAALATGEDNSEIVRLRAQLREQNIAAAKALKESLQAPPQAPVKRPLSAEDDEPADNVRLWEPGAKDRYYEAKFHVDMSTDGPVLVQDLAQAYVEGLCWVMAYYYQGCPSWKWFFPHHYAPFASDLTSIGDLHVRFELGEPFRPFDQLMGVFPAASSTHIPEPFRPLMTEPDSEVIDFYPETFHIDMNGKKAAWQGVALLPFIDEERLLRALEKVYPSLTPEQVRLNSRGDPKLFAHVDSAPRMPEGLEQEPSLVLSLDPSECANIGGSVKLDLGLCSLGSPYASPLTSIERIQGVSENRVRCFHFQLPYHERRSLHFRASLLPSVQLPVRRLTEEDRYLVQSGAASRSFSSRLVLNGRGGGGSFRPHHSMHQEYNQAQERQHQYSRGSDQPRRNDYQQDIRHEQRNNQRDRSPRGHPRDQSPREYSARDHSARDQVYPPPMPPPQHMPYPPPRPHDGPNAFAALAPRRPEDLYPPPAQVYPQGVPHGMPFPPPPPPGASAFHRPQPSQQHQQKRPGSGNMDDLYGIRRR
jgi:5'-3' exoribonuclease 2